MGVTRFIPKFVAKTAGKTALKMQQNAPHILFGVGIVGVVGGAVLACHATTKLPKLVDDFTDEYHGNKEHASPSDMTYIVQKNTVKIVKLYAPAVLVGGAGIICLTGSHMQLSKRNNALAAAYTGLASAYSAYRDRVREELGEEREMEIYHGVKTEDVVVDGDTFSIKTVDPNKLSMYARIFDESNANYKKDAEHNKIFIKAQQNYFNMLLHLRGHVFLNEVYEHLGFDHTSYGQIVGWVLNDEGDNFIDFGIYDAASSRFVNGWERAIVLDFNVDGPMFNKIK